MTQPAVLRSYGERYVGRIDPNFQHWQFASGSPEQVRKAANFFGLAYNTKDGQIVHGLSTVLIGKDGKVLKVYSGNAWKPDRRRRRHDGGDIWRMNSSSSPHAALAAW